MMSNPSCPKCSGPMIERIRKADQKPFWGCRRFPDCKGTRDIVIQPQPFVLEYEYDHVEGAKAVKSMEKSLARLQRKLQGRR